MLGALPMAPAWLAGAPSPSKAFVAKAPPNVRIPSVIERNPILRGFVSSLLAQRPLACVFQLEVTFLASDQACDLCGATHPLGVCFQYRQWRHLALCVRECT